MKPAIPSMVAALLISAVSIISPVASAQDVISQSKPKARLLNSDEKARFGAAKNDAEAKIAALLVAHHVVGDVGFYLKDRPLFMISEGSSEERVMFEIGARILSEKGAKWYLDGNRKEVFAIVKECWASSVQAQGLSPIGFSVSVDRGS